MTYIVFGYGSLIWKPPPHTSKQINGYVKGYVRRFAQSSNDHRGTPERPGRVVTLIRASEWEGLTGETHPVGQDPIVWGTACTIDPEMEGKVRDDLDHREKNGYTVDTVDVYDIVDGKETVVVHGATMYVGTLDNEAFIGSEPIDVLARRILSCSGASGPNKVYLYNLALAVQKLERHGERLDSYLAELEKRTRELDFEKEGGNNVDI